MTIQEMVLEFHRVFNCTVDSRDIDTVEHRLELVREEYSELWEEFDNLISTWSWNEWSKDDFENFTKEMADLVYVLYGTAIALGIDLDKAVELVHKSNMTKVFDDGRPRYKENGKVIKGPNYEKPDLRSVVKDL